MREQLHWKVGRKTITAKLGTKSARFRIDELDEAARQKFLVLGLKVWLVDRSLMSENRLRSMRNAFRNLKLGIWS